LSDSRAIEEICPSEDLLRKPTDVVVLQELLRIARVFATQPFFQWLAAGKDAEEALEEIAFFWWLHG